MVFNGTSNAVWLTICYCGPVKMNVFITACGKRRTFLSLVNGPFHNSTASGHSNVCLAFKNRPRCSFRYSIWSYIGKWFGNFGAKFDATVQCIIFGIYSVWWVTKYPFSFRFLIFVFLCRFVWMDGFARLYSTRVISHWPNCSITASRTQWFWQTFAAWFWGQLCRCRCSKVNLIAFVFLPPFS